MEDIDGEETKGTANGVPALASVITLICSAVGTGILSLPLVFERTGYLGGLALIGSIAVVESFTLYVLARSAEHTATTTYTTLVRRMLGRVCGAIVSISTFSFSFGSCCAFLMVIGDCLGPLLTAAAGEHWWTEREVVISVVGTTAVLPLCFPHSLGALAGVTSLVLPGLMFVVGSVVYRSMGKLHDPDYSWASIHAFVPRFSFLQALPILVYGFQCHTNVITIFREMEEEPKLLSPLLSRTTSAPRSAMTSWNNTGHGGSNALAALGPSGRRIRTPNDDTAHGMSQAAEAAGTMAGHVHGNAGVAGGQPPPEGQAGESAPGLLPPHTLSPRASSDDTAHDSSRALQAAVAAAAAGAAEAVEAGYAMLPPGDPREASSANGGPREWVHGGLTPLPARSLRSIKLLGMLRVVYSAVGLLASFYSVMGLAGYLAFQAHLQSNILNMFPRSDMLIQVARATVGVIVALSSYPMGHHPARAAVYDMLLQLTGRRGIPGFRSLETLTFYVATLAVALTVTDLGTVFTVIGGTCGGILIFGMPGVLLMNHSLQKKRATRHLPGLEQQPQYRLWLSKLWWAGIMLVLFTCVLILYTIWSVFWGPAPQ